MYFFLMIRRPPETKRTDTLFPNTTLFRSKFDLGIKKLSAGIYEPDIENGAIYTIGASRDGKTWLTPAEPGKRAFPVRNATLRGLQDLGRIVALPLHAIRKAA